MNYLLDTNVVLIFTRDSDIASEIQNKYQLFGEGNSLYISVVTVGELESLALQRNFGRQKWKKLKNVLSKLTIIDINIQEIITQYAQIDAFSQGKLKGKELGISARNMGKNDLWIAATASTYDLILITTDNDFSHLQGEYLQLEYINLKEFLHKP